MKVTFEGRSSRVIIRDALRKHTGIYKLTVTNATGRDEAEVEVVVLGKPSRPEGPLEVVDVTKDSAKLKWQPPKDDGGHGIK